MWGVVCVQFTTGKTYDTKSNRLGTDLPTVHTVLYFVCGSSKALDATVCMTCDKTGLLNVLLYEFFWVCCN